MPILFFMEQEIWVSVLGFEGRYEVSNLGRIKILNSRYRRHSDIVWTRVVRGYETVGLTLNGKSKHTMVHRVIAIAFIPNPENKPCVNHINGIKTDNRIENLEWVTHAENTKHAVDTGLLKGPCGEKNGCTALSNQQAIDIYNSTEKSDVLAIVYGVSKWVINSIKKGERWNTVTGAPAYQVKGFRDKLKEEDVIEIYTSHLSAKELASIKRVSIGMVHGIRFNRKWTEVTSKINFTPPDRRIKPNSPVHGQKKSKKPVIGVRVPV